ncbi:hypothetical protein SORBI_3005G097700 [Sorghum bicolor]|uniref:Uncharacterized protein n=1 Tax=Sorghum bicolor TaxID=4558 RepID=A0A1Z5RHM5_SORBI|nr:hypothetical protein SORBI_3005G097700 [Sorghum bicolor]
MPFTRPSSFASPAQSTFLEILLLPRGPPGQGADHQPPGQGCRSPGHPPSPLPPSPRFWRHWGCLGRAGEAGTPPRPGRSRGAANAWAGKAMQGRRTAAAPSEEGAGASPRGRRGREGEGRCHTGAGKAAHVGVGKAALRWLCAAHGVTEGNQSEGKGRRKG